MSGPTGALVEVVVDPPVATLTLNRPQRHNSLVPDLLRSLIEEAVRCESDRSVGVLVLAANGRSFSTGGDIREFYDHRDRLVEYAHELVGLLNDAMLTLMRLRPPVVAAVHGIVTGGSLGLLLASDAVVVARRATITPWYSVVGFAPDGGWSTIMPGRIGRARTADVLASNRTITADESIAWGLADRVVDDDAFDDAVAAVAAELANPKAAARKAARNVDLDAVAAELERERQAFLEQVGSHEAATGMAAFLGID